MAVFPDVYCWIKLVNKNTGYAVPSGTQFSNSADVIVRYVVANDSHNTAGPLWVVGRLKKNGVYVQPNVVPAQQITVQPNHIWKAEHEVKDKAAGVDTFDATLLGDIGNTVNEEDEKNNKAASEFTVAFVPP